MGRRPGSSQQIRLIAGRFGGRRLCFPDLDGLRPTGDRMRETLFSWLQPLLPGSRCLDLFAGSGALGFECASRGAARVVMVEQHPQAVRQLRDNAALLGAEAVEVVQADALRWLAEGDEPFDIVLVDPPFASRAQIPVLRQLLASRRLRPAARIYVESGDDDPFRALPEGLRSLRQKRAGQVHYALLVYQPFEPSE